MVDDKEISVNRLGSMRVWLICCIAFFALWAFSGVYLSSMDDCLLNTLYSGTLAIGPITTAPGYASSYPDFFYSHFMVWLYRLWPAWSWHGLALITLNSVSIALIISLLNKMLADSFLGKTILVRAVLILSFCAIFILEPLVLMTYTSTAILLCGSSILYLGYLIRAEGVSFYRIAPLILLFCISLSLRFQASIFTLVVLFILEGILNYKFFFKRKVIAVLVLILFCVVVLRISNVSLQSPDQTAIEAFDQYYFSLHDAKVLKPESVVIKDSTAALKLILFKSWFFPDQKILNVDELKKITYDSPFVMENFLNLRAKLGMALRVSMEYKEYLFYTNWGIQFALGLFLNLSLVMVALFLPIPRPTKFSISVFNSAFWAIILAVAAVVWMRHRLFVALLALYSLMNFVLVFRLTAKYAAEQAAKTIRFSLVIVLIVAAVFKVFCIEKSASDKAVELKSKQNFEKHLNAMNDKIIVFDTYTICLLGNDPIRNTPMNKSNKLITAGEYYLCFMQEYKDFWRQECGSSDYIDIMKYLEAHSDKSLFMSGSSKMSLVRNYLEHFYQFPVSFRQVMPERVAYSLLPVNDSSMGYYVIKREVGQ